VSSQEDIPARLVKELRDITGAGMMECKNALRKTAGNIEMAVQLLRERGMAQASRRAGRKTTEGKVLAHVENGRGAMVAVGAETEPVSNNDEFLTYARHVLDAVEEQGPEAAGKLEEERIGLVARIGENIEVRGAARFEAEDGEVVSAYVHPPAQKIGVLVRVKGSPEVARAVAMHISFANPRYRLRDEVPREEVATERAIYEKQPDVVSKPEQIRPRIVEGMMAKRFFAQSVLVDQPWIHDDSKSVGMALAEHGAEVLEFARFALAE
jgi:elongation factor Ts